MSLLRNNKNKKKFHKHTSSLPVLHHHTIRNNKNKHTISSMDVFAAFLPTPSPGSAFKDINENVVVPRGYHKRTESLPAIGLYKNFVQRSLFEREKAIIVDENDNARIWEGALCLQRQLHKKYKKLQRNRETAYKHYLTKKGIDHIMRLDAEEKKRDRIEKRNIKLQEHKRIKDKQQQYNINNSNSLYNTESNYYNDNQTDNNNITKTSKTESNLYIDEVAYRSTMKERLKQVKIDRVKIEKAYNELEAKKQKEKEAQKAKTKQLVAVFKKQAKKISHITRIERLTKLETEYRNIQKMLEQEDAIENEILENTRREYLKISHETSMVVPQSIMHRGFIFEHTIEVLCTLTAQEREILFKQFDVDDSGNIKGIEFDDLVHCIVDIYFANKKKCIQIQLQAKYEHNKKKILESPTAVIDKDMFVHVKDDYVYTDTDKEIQTEKALDLIFELMDFNHDKKISHAEFITGWNGFAKEYYNDLGMKNVTI